MRRSFLFLLPAAMLLASCASIRVASSSAMAKDTRQLLNPPARIDQAAWTPQGGTEQTSYFLTQSLLYAELGARFYNLKDYETARNFFDLAYKYDKRNAKALFSLAVLDFDEGQYERAIERWASIPPRDKPLYPYDIDYYEAARILLSQFPIEGRVVSLSRGDWAPRSENVVVVNRGSAHGLRPGMALNVFRIGNPIRDFETLEVIGRQRAKIASLKVIEADERNAICSVLAMEPGYFLQVNDLVQTTFGVKR